MGRSGRLWFESIVVKIIDLAKRRRVMERSIALDHCICNVRQPSPCDIFRKQDLCPCAGVVPGATERNREFVGGAITVEAGVDEALIHLGFDAWCAIAMGSAPVRKFYREKLPALKAPRHLGCCA